MIYTITFNPSLDYIADCENFELGKTNRTTKELMYAGGKGINVSIVLRNLNVETTAFGFLAGFTGKEIQRLIKEEGINDEMIWLNNGFSRLNLKLRSKVETELNGMGPIIDKNAINDLYKKLDNIKEKDTLVLAGSIPASMPETMYRDIMKYLDKRNIRIVVDATKELLLNVLEYHPFLIKPNINELGELFDKVLKAKEEIIFYAKKLQEKGARNVLVSMAGDGAVLVGENGEVFYSPAPKGKVVNSVGAGDSMIAGFLYGYELEHNYGDAFKYGICTGSASAFSEELAKKAEVEELIEKFEG